MIPHSTAASTSVSLRIAGTIGATFLILLTLLAIVRPDMMNLAAMMRHLAAGW